MVLVPFDELEYVYTHSFCRHLRLTIILRRKGFVGERGVGHDETELMGLSVCNFNRGG